MASNTSRIIGIRFPKTLIQKLDEEAARRDRSRNYIVVEQVMKKYEEATTTKATEYDWKPGTKPKPATKKKAGAR
jgi:predicted transcriptional regulator